ncbi:molybdopterin cofactor-binding domain-containing protein [Candidatus Palauibacter sp.]|uniref:xanthine dehydrogenase family protein molybdopterin-binding subunit n=1 Tax=Candidatus Palauibacter sp. TaxID=3101350 RepID=UPI003B52592B
MKAPRELPPAIDDALAPWEGTTSRRDFLRTSGLFVLGFSGVGIVGIGRRAPGGGPPEANPYPDPDFLQLDSWLVVHEDGTATFYVGKTDGGQGTGTAMRQMMCDELDIAYDAATLVMGRTDMTVDQGGSGGSDAIERDAIAARRVAAEARRALLELASERFELPVEDLAVSEGIISVGADPSRRVTYGELIGGRRFDVALTGRNVNETAGLASVKPVQELKIVGQPIPRYDIPAKVDGSLEWAVDVKLPGMVHARNVRPPLAGARLIAVDESSVRDIPGFLRVVREGNYLAVVCEREEQAIEAAERLEAEWERPATPPFPSSEDLFDYMRGAPAANAGGSGSTPRARVEGDPGAALASAATVVEAAYDIPFQGHTAIGPAHGVADPSDGQMTVYTNDMKPYSHRTGIADFLGMPPERVRVIWMEGPQLYGRTAADDAGFEAAYLARELGRPVRVQWMRHEETAWDTKGPAFAVDLRGGLDAAGNLLALDYRARIANYAHLGYNQSDTVLIAQLMGIRPERPSPGGGGGPDEMYHIPNRREETRPVRFPLAFETPLRTGNLRDPNGPQTTFAGESFIDELAAAAHADPVEFRLRLLRGSSEDDDAFLRARSIAVVEAATETYGWDPRPSPVSPAARAADAGRILTGRGIAYAYRARTVVATIAEVEVDRESGRVWVRRMVCAHDCGLVINPDGLESTVQGNLLHGISRTLYEEVRFDGEKVTSVDWRTHPTLTHTDAPERIDVVIVNGDPNPDRPDLPHYGAGEPSHRTVAAAVANAIHDATGVRLRRIPLRPERVLAALTAAGV